MGKLVDLTGQRFGRLVVLHRGETRYTSGGNPIVRWHCKCDCGNELDIDAGSLRTGHTKSCGCYNLDMVSERMHKMRKGFNKYEFTDKDAIIYDSKGNKAYIDIEDYDLVKDFCWHKHHDYMEAKDCSTGKHIMLHKLILNDLESKYCGDHKDGNTMNNRKSNLRRATSSQNNMNRKIMKSNTSGATGVVWHKRDGVWEASISVDNNKIYLGRFQNFDDAVKIRKEAEEKYFGEYSFSNSRKE